MKKKILLTGLILCTLQLVGCTSTKTKEAHIGVENAKAAALEAAGFASQEVTFTDAELDTENGLIHYDIDFVVNGQKYEYDVDALTGEILGYEVDSYNGIA